MADQKVKILVSAEDKASAELKKVNKELTNTGKEAKTASKSFSDSFTEMKAQFDSINQAAKIFSSTFKEIFEAGRAGAAVNQTAESFEYLRQKVGANADLLEQLSKAANGTITELDIMQSSAVLLAGTSGEMATEFANALPGLMEMAKAANKLNPSLGDTTFLFDSLAKGIKRGSPMILDNLGIIVSLEEANQKYAKSLGISTDALTAEQKKIALLNETMEKGATLMDQVGGSTESATDAYDRMTASIENLTNRIKAGLAPAITNAAEAVTTLITAQQTIKEQTIEHTEAVIYSTESYEEYEKELERVADLIGGRSVYWINKLSESEYELARATEDAGSQEWGLEQAAKAATTALVGQEEAVIEVEDATNNAVAAMKKYSEQLLFQIASQGLNEYQALQLAYAMGLVDEKTVYATQKTMEYNTMLQNGTITLEEFNQKIVGVNEALEGTPREINIDMYLKLHGMDAIQQIQSMGGGTTESGAGGTGFVARSAGGGVRPGQTVIVGESGPEILQMGQNGGHIYPTNVTNNFNLGVTTLQNANSIQTAFAIMQAMA